MFQAKFAKCAQSSVSQHGSNFGHLKNTIAELVLGGPDLYNFHEEPEQFFPMIIVAVLSDSSSVAHDCGYPLSRYTCRATRVAADFLDFRAFCRCSTGVALHPLKILVSHLPPPPPVPGGVAPKFGSEKVSRYTGVSQLQLRVSRYTVQLSLGKKTLRVLVPARLCAGSQFAGH